MFIFSFMDDLVGGTGRGPISHVNKLVRINFTGTEMDAVISIEIETSPLSIFINSLFKNGMAGCC